MRVTNVTYDGMTTSCPCGGHEHPERLARLEARIDALEADRDRLTAAIRAARSKLPPVFARLLPEV